MQTAPSPESQAVMQVLGADAWARFDIWSNRAWEAAQGAIAVVESSPTSADDGMDTRVIPFFHASEVAKDFAMATNPLFAVSGAAPTRESAADEMASLDACMLLENEDD